MMEVPVKYNRLQIISEDEDETTNTSGQSGSGASERATLLTNDTDRSMRTVMLPNIPDPVNGMIRTYENSSRTFTRPYSAKTVFFYKDGDEYFTGVRVPVSKSRYRTIDSLLDDLNQNLQMPFGVRRLTTPMGRNRIESIDQLQHLGKYVATSGKMARGLNLSGVERLKKAREQAQNALRRERPGGQSYWIPASPSYKQKLRMSRTLGLNIVPCKQVFFVLNGKTQMYRSVLNPLKLPSMEALLQELSVRLEVAVDQLYDQNGVRIRTVDEIMAVSPPKIIAAPRNERVQLRENFSLPAIFSNKSLSSNNSSNKSNDSVSYKLNGRVGFASTSLNGGSITDRSINNQENGIEKPRKNATNTAVRRNTRKMTGMPKKRTVKRAASVEAPESTHSKGDDVDSGKAASIDGSVRTAETSDSQRSREDDERASASGSGPSEDSGSAIEEENESAIGSEANEDNAEAVDHGESGGIEEVEENKDAVHEDTGQQIGESLRKDVDEAANEPAVASDEADTSEAVSSNQDERDAAATKIQATYRGYRTRKRLKKTEGGLPEGTHQENENDDSENTENAEETSKTNEAADGEATEKEHANDGDTRDENGPDRTPTPDRQEKAAIKIQAVFRGYNTRKHLKHVGFSEEPPLILENQGVETPDMEDRPDTEEPVRDAVVEEPKKPSTAQGGEPMITYTVSVLTGNRWGADTEADLYVVIYGDDRTSKKFELTQEDSRNWLQNDESKHKANQLDSFHLESPNLGTLNKITIGHEKRGYGKYLGAGVFVDYVLVTENIVDGRQFVFFCSKWLDSGQVDGKIERSLPVSAFYYISSIPEDTMTTQGRWEFILHNGTRDGLGGTTSNLNIVGYGTEGSSVTTITTDKTLQQVPSTSLIQVDFGEIGDLLKVRFEVDGTGDKPDYFLEYVELRDLDTEERVAVRVGKWLDITGEHSKKAQPFREISVFRAGVQPLPVMSYEGKVYGADFSLLKSNQLKAQIIGEFSDSGVFPLTTVPKSKNAFSFKAECVYLGRVHGVRVIGDFSEFGEGVLEGFSLLQEIYDKHGLNEMNMGANIVATSAHVRESTHCPYRYVMALGRILDLPDNEEKGLYFKHLALTGMEGLSTRNKKDIRESAEDHWALSLSLKEGSNAFPYAEICAGPSSYSMQIKHEEEKTTESELKYTLRSKPVGVVDKVRLGVDKLGEYKLAVKKMRLVNTQTGEEIRYPSVDTVFTDHSVFEFPTVYPDVPPKQNHVYSLQIVTESVGGVIIPIVTLVGHNGTSGRRLLRPEEAPIETGMISTFEVEAVDLGVLETVYVSYQAERNVDWNFVLKLSGGSSSVDYTTESIKISEADVETACSLQEDPSSHSEQ